MDVVRQLRELQELRSAGVLTDAQFEQAKQLVLSGQETDSGGGVASGEIVRGAASVPEGGAVPAALSSAVAPAVGTQDDRVYKAVVRAGPEGATVAELADQSGVAASELERVLPGLEADGLVCPARDRWVRRPGSPTSVPGGPARKRQNERGSGRPEWMDVPQSALTSSREPAVSVGGWAVAIFLFGFVGGAIGYFAVKDRDPARANHIMKWGLIWTLVSWLFWLVLLGALAGT